ncbi:hypothetical protein IFM89_019222 [Coptis chinensis]|uniref:Uncharacterized protein n=1 Tax=Coptis chinensis TaxID=261450 RepID=A0A835MA33_9MAGN|nr:hypothetical protein IFM89_019222 [Coptis chinensis]
MKAAIKNHPDKVEILRSLRKALCGFNFVLSHLDARKLLIKSQPGEVVKPDQFKVISDEWMPMYQRPFMMRMKRCMEVLKGYNVLNSNQDFKERRIA